jgi:hypothetical protein
VLQSQEALERVDLIINKWFLDASIPFNATTSRYYQPMIDAISSIDSGYKGPSMYRMCGPLLTKNVEATKMFAESLMCTHASILVDSVGPPSVEVCRTATSFS